MFFIILLAGLESRITMYGMQIFRSIRSLVKFPLGRNSSAHNYTATTDGI